MALNIKNPEVEKLAAELSKMTGENKTQAIRKALEERKERLKLQEGDERSFEALMALMEERIWSKIPDSVRGKGISQEEQDEILGYGPEGF